MASSESIIDKIRNALFPTMVLLVLLMMTVGITYNFYQNSKSKDINRFNSEVGRAQSAFNHRFSLYISLLEGGRGFVESVENLRLQNFKKYVGSLDLKTDYAGIQGIGYSMIIPSGGQNDLVKEMESQGQTDFKIFPLNNSDFITSIVYLEPSDERNVKAIGYDMSTEENRREAMMRARDTAKPAATAKVLLLQEITKDKQAGFLIYLPVYKNGNIPETLIERQKELIGFIYAPVRSGDFLNDLLSNASIGQLGFAVFDEEIKAETLMAKTFDDSAAVFADRLNEPYQTQTEILVAGRSWKIKYFALPAFIDQSSVGWTPLIFVIGVAFSFLLFGMTYWETLARKKLQQTASELFELEKQKHDLLNKEKIARLAAERANATKDEFIDVVSHELKTPLNTIAGWTRILRGDNLSEKTKRLALAKIEKSLRSQTKLVEALLEYSEILAGQTNLTERRLDFGRMVSQLIEEIVPIAAGRDITVVPDISLELQYICGDEKKLKMALSNLLTNSVKFSKPGGTINVRVLKNGENMEMHVKDHGQGISEELLPHIFERFRQGDTSTTRNIGGLGLGLTISAQIIRLHGGTIDVVSDGEGKGSVFTVKLPCIND